MIQIFSHRQGASIVKVLLIIFGVILLFVGLVFVFTVLLGKPATNTNTNVSNSNAVGNANVSSNANQNTNTAGTVVDADQDGLADAYEPAYRALVTSKDTDQDGNMDSLELFYGYKPNTTGKLFKNDIRENLLPKPATISDPTLGQYIEGQIVLKFRERVTIQDALAILIDNKLGYIPLFIEGPDIQTVNSQETVLYSDSFSFPTLRQLQVQVPLGTEQQWVVTLGRNSQIESAKLNLIANSNTNNNTNTGQ